MLRPLVSGGGNGASEPSTGCGARAGGTAGVQPKPEALRIRGDVSPFLEDRGNTGQLAGWALPPANAAERPAGPTAPTPAGALPGPADSQSLGPRAGDVRLR